MNEPQKAERWSTQGHTFSLLLPQVQDGSAWCHHHPRGHERPSPRWQLDFSVHKPLPLFSLQPTPRSWAVRVCSCCSHLPSLSLSSSLSEPLFFPYHPSNLKAVIGNKWGGSGGRNHLLDSKKSRDWRASLSASCLMHHLPALWTWWAASPVFPGSHIIKTTQSLPPRVTRRV